ncbi:MAG TPA: zinc-dependent alcohol dehydrogenase [Actinospica sp.]|jgi:propanol-preferring alcohol dehydrogenase|nr:zinc-dependent alcohol dehydrogenase [Actinospica sp.]
MTTTMKAAVVPALGAKIEVRDLPIPVPGPGQVLVRMETSGVCHTDIHAANGDWAAKPTTPYTPGHEGVGIVEAQGLGASLHQVGERVALAWLGTACGTCSYCVTGAENLCTKQKNNGFALDGTYAEYAVADDRYVVTVPDAVTPFDAAPLTCAGLTTYKAVKVARLAPGETVVIYGIGGLGHLAVQYAKIFGARVIAVDIDDAKLELATRLGADEVIDGRVGDAARAVRKLGGADVAIALAVSPRAFEQAYGSLRRGGRLVCVALPADGTMNIPIFDTVISGKSIIGSIVGTRQDLADVFALHAAGRTQVIAESRRLDQVNECFDDVAGGRVPARLVFEF